jgi:hypothetical protein
MMRTPHSLASPAHRASDIASVKVFQARPWKPAGASYCSAIKRNSTLTSLDEKHLCRKGKNM